MGQGFLHQYNQQTGLKWIKWTNEKFWEIYIVWSAIIYGYTFTLFIVLFNTVPTNDVKHVDMASKVTEYKFIGGILSF